MHRIYYLVIIHVKYYLSGKTYIWMVGKCTQNCAITFTGACVVPFSQGTVFIHCPPFLMYRKHLPNYKTESLPKRNKEKVAVFSQQSTFETLYVLTRSRSAFFPLLRMNPFYGLTRLDVSIHSLLVITSSQGLQPYADMLCKHSWAGADVSVGVL